VKKVNGDCEKSDKPQEATGDCEKSKPEEATGDREKSDKPEEEKALEVQAETEKLKAKGPYRQTQIGSEAVNVKRMTPIDKHK
jgi:hypothetical protein